MRVGMGIVLRGMMQDATGIEGISSNRIRQGQSDIGLDKIALACGGGVRKQARV